MRWNRLQVWVVVLVSMFVLAVSAWAHEKHAHRAAGPPRHAENESDSVPAPPGLIPTSSAAQDSATSEPPFQMPPMGDAVRHHLHNKIVHFPIVLAPLALVVLLLSGRRSDLTGPSKALAWLAALSAGMALWAGLAQAPDFEGEPKEWLVHTHRFWGIATTVALALAALLGQWSRARRFAWIMALLGIILVAVAGFLGGLVSHG